MSVESYFRQQAETFDALYEGRGLQHWFNRWARAAIFERVRLALLEMQGCHDFTVLDLGCGSGRNSALFAHAGARRVLGVDFSNRMIDLARDFCRAQDVASRCEFVQADFLKHEFVSKFDFVIALGVFDYLDDPRLALRRMLALANRKVIASFPWKSPIRAPLRKMRYALRHCPVYFYSKEELDHICRDVGLTGYKLLPCTSAGCVLVGEATAANSATQGGHR